MANASKGFQHDNKAPIGATRESLWDTIVIINPRETYVATSSEQISVGDVVHSWPQKSTRSVTGRASVQGADPTYDNTDTTRASNVTQIIQIGYELTGSRAGAPNAVGGDPMAAEKREAMSTWKNELEFSLVRGSLNTGNDSTASRAKGLKYFASTLATLESGKSLDESKYNAYMGNAWDQGIEIDTVLVGRVHKQRISGFTAGSTKNVDAEESTLYGRVDIYDGDWGRQRIMKHRYVWQSGDNQYDFLAYESSYVKVGVYRPVKNEPLAKTGDAERGQTIGEYTLQVGNEKAVVLSNTL